MTYDGIINDVKRQIIDELHKPARQNFRTRRTMIKRYADLWQADLLEMQTFASKNCGYWYILVVIDCYFKYVWTESIKNKTSDELSKAFENVLKIAKYSPKNLQTDNGPEFYNRSFSELMSRYNINHYSTFSTKNSKPLLNVYYLHEEISGRGKYRWVDILQDITSKYKDKVQRTISMKPIDVTHTT